MCLYVRSLKLKEGRKIQVILRRGKNRTAIRHTQVVLMSAHEMRVKDTALQTLLHPEYVRRLIRGFNTEGPRLFEERSGRGRNKKVLRLADRREAYPRLNIIFRGMSVKDFVTILVAAWWGRRKNPLGCLRGRMSESEKSPTSISASSTEKSDFYPGNRKTISR